MSDAGPWPVQAVPWARGPWATALKFGIQCLKAWGVNSKGRVVARGKLRLRRPNTCPRPGGECRGMQRAILNSNWGPEADL